MASVIEITQYLTFKLDQEDFALEIEQVREVLDVSSITRIPRMPDFMRGVINLRGNVVPVVDLRLKFCMPKTETTINTCIIIVEVSIDGDKTILGMLADSVDEVLDLEPGQIDSAPRIGASLSTEFIKGLGKKDDRFLIILDIDRIFSPGELEQVQSSQVKEQLR